MARHRTALGLVGISAGMVALWVGVAFACTPQIRSYAVAPESAAPGSTVTVQGRDISSASPVEIRWNGTRGQVLGVARAGADGSFSVPVQVPDVAPGVYAMTLVSTDAGVGRSAFEVTVAAGLVPASPGANLWSSVADQASAPVADGPPGAAGVALLALGLVGLAAGSTVAVAGRRRAVAAGRY